MGVASQDEVLDLPGVPDGVVARRVREYRRGPSGEALERRSRRGLRKLTRVELAPAGALAPVEFSDSEERWVLGAVRRRWGTVEDRYGDAAMTRAVELVRAGAVTLICPVDEQMRVGAPSAWALTDAWAQRAADRAWDQREHRARWSRAAVNAADAVERLCPALATALRARPAGGATTSVLVHAATDLVDGVIHDGPRAFSQAHFADTKAHDDVAEVLRRAGVGDDVIAALGVTRSSWIGVAGPVAAVVAGRNVELSVLHGPVLIRADQPGLELATRSGSVLVVVENLQAAEVLADRMPDVVVVYTAGPPADASLSLVAGLGRTAASRLVVPDADLGGVRIAERVLTALPDARVLDIGDETHPQSDLWPSNGVSVAGLHAAQSGKAAELATACLERGYPVEQELATVRAVRRALG